MTVYIRDSIILLAIIWLLEVIFKNRLLVDEKIIRRIAKGSDDFEAALSQLEMELIKKERTMSILHQEKASYMQLIAEIGSKIVFSSLEKDIVSQTMTIGDLEHILVDERTLRRQKDEYDEVAGKILSIPSPVDLER